MTKKAWHCSACKDTNYTIGMGKCIDGRYRPLCKTCRFAAKVSMLMARWRVAA